GPGAVQGAGQGGQGGPGSEGGVRRAGPGRAGAARALRRAGGVGEPAVHGEGGQGREGDGGEPDGRGAEALRRGGQGQERQARREGTGRGAQQAVDAAAVRGPRWGAARAGGGGEEVTWERSLLSVPGWRRR